MTDVTIVGGGPCGLGVAMYLRQLLPDVRVTILDRGTADGGDSGDGDIGCGSPLASTSATQLLSQNVSETACGAFFRTMESAGIITEESDEHLSSTTGERPRGWSRSSGQWRHYLCPDRAALFDAMRRQSACPNVCICRGEAASVSVSGDGIALRVAYAVGSQPDGQSSRGRDEKGGSICKTEGQRGQEGQEGQQGQEGQEQSEALLRCSILVLAVPAHEALRLAAALPLPEAAQRVLESRSSSSLAETRHCTTIFVARASLVGSRLLAHFPGGLRELDVSSVAGEITLLALGAHRDDGGGVDVGGVDDVGDVGGDGVDLDDARSMQLHVHARSSDALGRAALTAWLAAWLSLDAADSAVSFAPATAAATPAATVPGVALRGHEGRIRGYPQARPSVAPLSPLREKGCIVVPLSPALVVISGDWAVGESAGTVSGALLSAVRAAKEVADHVKSASP